MATGIKMLTRNSFQSVINSNNFLRASNSSTRKFSTGPVEKKVELMMQKKPEDNYEMKNKMNLSKVIGGVIVAAVITELYDLYNEPSNANIKKEKKGDSMASRVNNESEQYCRVVGDSTNCFTLKGQVNVYTKYPNVSLTTVTCQKGGELPRVRINFPNPQIFEDKDYKVIAFPKSETKLKIIAISKFNHQPVEFEVKVIKYPDVNPALNEKYIAVLKSYSLSMEEKAEKLEELLKYPNHHEYPMIPPQFINDAFGTNFREDVFLRDLVNDLPKPDRRKYIKVEAKPPFCAGL